MQVRKVLHTEDYDDISESFEYEGTVEQLKEQLSPVLSRATRYTFYYMDSEGNWKKITK